MSQPKTFRTDEGKETEDCKNGAKQNYMVLMRRVTRQVQGWLHGQGHGPHRNYNFVVKNV